MEAVLGWTAKSMCGPLAFRGAKDQVFGQMASIKDKESMVDLFSQRPRHSTVLGPDLTVSQWPLLLTAAGEAGDKQRD